MSSNRQSDVRAFMEKFSQPNRITPGWPTQEDLDMRIRMLTEEFCELVQACGYEGNLWIGRLNLDTANTDQVASWSHEPELINQIELGSLPDAIDGAVDLEYVLHGLYEQLGVDSQPFWDQVHESNMRKEGGGTREDGKILKPQGWEPPDIAGELRKQGWEE